MPVGAGVAVGSMVAQPQAEGRPRRAAGEEQRQLEQPFKRGAAVLRGSRAVTLTALRCHGDSQGGSRAATLAVTMAAATATLTARAARRAVRVAAGAAT